MKFKDVPEYIPFEKRIPSTVTGIEIVYALQMVLIKIQILEERIARLEEMDARTFS